MMRLHVVQHVPFEGPAEIARWAVHRSFPVTVSCVFNRDPLPTTDLFDALVVMGGPMGANDDAQFSWMTEEKRVLGEAIAAGKKVIGVCLGAQLIANVLGARVYPNDEREIGWFDVTLTEVGRKWAPFREHPNSFSALHWHGDTFDLPAGALHLVTSAGCRHQAFSYGENVLGLQYHLEVGALEAQGLIENSTQDFRPGRYVSTPENVLGNKEAFQTSRDLLRSLLDSFLI